MAGYVQEIKFAWTKMTAFCKSNCSSILIDWDREGEVEGSSSTRLDCFE